MAERTDTGAREAIVRELAETHGNAAYLADNLAAVRAERDEYVADVERMTGPDARERLARHLYLQAHSDDQYAQPHWDHGGDQHVNKADWRAKADAILAVITGQGK